MRPFGFILAILVSSIAASPQFRHSEGVSKNKGDHNYLPPGTVGPGNAPINEVSVNPYLSPKARPAP